MPTNPAYTARLRSLLDAVDVVLMSADLPDGSDADELDSLSYAAVELAETLTSVISRLERARMAYHLDWRP